MGFVKLDQGILDSTLWINRNEREVFITALLMAQPYEAKEPMHQLEVDSLKPTGFVVPAGWYGFIGAAGPGIIRRASVEDGPGLEALRSLGSADAQSRSHDFEGRRLIRVDGGYLVLNFMRYRDKDHTAKERQRRLRERKKLSTPGQHVTPLPIDVTRDETVTSRNVTQSESREQRHTTNKLTASPGRFASAEGIRSALDQMRASWEDTFGAPVPTEARFREAMPNLRPEDVGPFCMAFSTYLERLTDATTFNPVRFSSSWKFYLEKPKGA